MTDRRTQLLQCAAEMFAQRGFHGVSVDDLGAAAGVSGPALYRHFPSKDAVLQDLLLGISQALLDEGQRRAAAAPDAGSALGSLIEGHVQFALTQPDLITVQERDLHHVPTPARRRVRQLQRRYVELWVQSIVDHFHASPDTALSAAHAAFGLINSTPHSARLAPGPMADLLRRMAWGALVAGTNAPHMVGRDWESETPSLL